MKTHTSSVTLRATLDQGGRLVQTSQFVALDCKITRGGFSDERIFKLRRHDGTEYTGIASRRYCWGPDDRLLAADEPPSADEWIKGKVAARILSADGREADVSVPDGEAITVNVDQLRARPSEAGINVPVGS
jgi:hypothetical protein